MTAIKFKQRLQSFPILQNIAFCIFRDSYAAEFETFRQF